MSRTYRRTEDYVYHAHGNYYTYEELKEYRKEEEPFETEFPWRKPSSHWGSKYIIHKKGRDQKPWNKPAKWFKKMNRRIERAKVKHLMRNDKHDLITKFPNTDQWDWS